MPAVGCRLGNVPSHEPGSADDENPHGVIMPG
jgi:hypothetical protein